MHSEPIYARRTRIEYKKFRAIAGKVGFLALVLSAGPIHAQSFRVQCPQQTTLHPTAGTTPGQIKCQHIAGSDGYATMADGHQIYLFGFAPLSGQQKLLTGIEGTQTAADFSQTYSGPAGVLDFANYPATPPGDAAVVEPAQMMNTGVLFANTPAPQIAIDEDNDVAASSLGPCVNGRALAPVLFETNQAHLWDALNRFGGSIHRAIVHEDQFIIETGESGTQFVLEN